MKPLDLNRLTGMSEFFYLKEDIKNDLPKHILEFESGTLGPREMVYLFEELGNSHFIFKSGGRFGRTTEGLVRDGYFQFIPDEQKFAQKINGVQLPSNQSTEDLILDWKSGILSEQESAALVLKTIKEDKLSLLRGDTNSAKVFMFLLQENYVRLVANEQAIEVFLEKAGLNK